MFKKHILLLIPLFLFLNFNASAQVDEDQTGAWYMYFWNTSFGDSQWGLQGDIQYRNWDLGGDLEQLLIRGGLTYSPMNADVKFTLGYGNITSGEFGDGNETSGESRIYQEALLPHKLSSRFYLTHRFRYEQRWVENQDFRTRYRYNIFLNVPLNQANLNKDAVYLALYNEIFINGEREIGDGRSVELFDRNRFYSALGYVIKDNLKVQAGYMIQTTDALSKGQVQLSLHHSF
ncbi:DUF2490 domain-containing protein [Salegentibacter sp. F188]|uniref:DUF2490 domain-containing protein n=1 Tax=Autumnicola patrickiae TaxID=3075591 RepID=A0ABU3E6G1_9FLAO|nr:DUF2490 domain-containing protein [Salegentibacter sp. F188]MDT0690807.1 DUF2490 domain-containing protein [Salegentibacter sp. F188]